MKKRNWLILGVTGALVVSLLLTACPAPEEKPVIELKYNTMGPQALTSASIPLDWMASELPKRTEGRVEMTVLYGSPLAPPPAIYDSLATGVFDLADSMATYFIGRLPASEIGELPLGNPGAVVMSHALQDWYDKFKPEEWEEVKFLAVVSSPPAVIGTRDVPVRSLDDLEGLTLRVPGSTVAATVTALGALPRDIPVGEIYEQVSKGVVSGAALSIEAYPGFKLHEVIKYATDLGDASWGCFIFMAMNRDSWNKLEKKDQQILAELALEAWESRARLVAEGEAAAKELFLAQPGREYITLPPAEIARIQQAAKVVVDGYIEDLEAKGMPGADYVEYLKERIDYWSKQ